MVRHENEYFLSSSARDGTGKLFFEGKMLPAGHGHSDYVLLFDETDRRFRLEKLDGVIKMSKSREPEKIQKRIETILRHPAPQPSIKKESAVIKKRTVLSKPTVSRVSKPAKPVGKRIPALFKPQKLAKTADKRPLNRIPSRTGSQSSSQTGPPDTPTDQDADFDKAFDEAMGDLTDLTELTSEEE
ncbi:hypothetical protein OGAPHI_000036 [Ogataea philodendri]|uniref:Transcription elongation factor Eaf N-terminal domain-containing protein n=1 Tax=Ogataea philodendri TaxID=1378263 RepID=A0A9P8PHQ9_9ASCO|nr:uncharacterized protein OGAPHI_000036 [Ogataea philodendri]KAH3671850.1 hypothetical protein OGAPHI_000036 [Ogataea philodendri]